MKFFDLHIHSEPDIYKRKYSVDSLNKELYDNNSFGVYKSHSITTISNTNNFNNLFGSVVLNSTQGGLSLETLYNMIQSTKKPFIIWLPTINKIFLNIKNNKINMSPVEISENGKIKDEIKSIIKFCGENNLPIATGHSKKDEIFKVIKICKEENAKLIITHPFYRLTNFSINELTFISELYENIYFECCILMGLDNFDSIKKDIQLINTIGSKRVFVSSDLGQINNCKVSEGYRWYKNQLVNCFGIDDNIINDLFYYTPKKILLGEN
ncbi:DUF6282 family protein [Staphylococcus sp. EZ-P03]|uniref:DUF6282 family protein n=1 Tax=Staphylococcus sp. EZ-P03 TaxID=2282739 RepID=UPI000DF7BCB4|nr:DUF6282 family protein [Staphylococcus sp. EZ-P03]